MKKTDIQLKQDIETELRWDPKVNSAQIGVTVDEGAVSLFGAVGSYPQKWAAEQATKRVSGVRTVAQDLSVKILADHQHTDSEIANAVQNALEWDVFTPKTVTARVHDCVVTLEGQVKWNFERHAAEKAVRVSGSRVKEKIQSALQRQAAKDTSSIHIHTAGSKVTLTGPASSWQSIEDAADAAWAAPGVTEVVDEMQVQRSH